VSATPARGQLPLLDGEVRRTVYVPFMSDHVVVLRGALHRHGIECELLPPPDDETLAIGLDLCRGRECLPCFLASGDVIRACRNGTIDPANGAVLMPASPGPCRFGQYRILQRTLLDREGFADVEILSPSSENSYRGFGKHPKLLRLLVWEGIVAVDFLLKLRYEFRPYELRKGATEEAYQRGLELIEEAVELGGGKPVLDALDCIAADFAAIEANRSTPKPVVAMLGEIYVMLNDRSNQDLILQLEDAGSEVVTGTLSEWLYFADETKMDRDILFGAWGSLLGTKALRAYQHRVERRMFARVKHLLRQPPDSPMRRLFEMATPYFDPLLGTETLLTVSKVVHYAQSGVSGIVNVMPFSCMPGIVVSGMSARMRRDFEQLPWLDVNFDGQRITNIRTRLEAFVHQVTQFARSRGRLEVESRPDDSNALPEPVAEGEGERGFGLAFPQNA
jgi:predicted nucleotide-binding protein (sugar kinase/HSP70/actin superfamily)